MTEETKESFFREVDLHCKSNNDKHHTSEISEEQLIVRRGLCFDLTITLTEPLNSEQHELVISAMTGQDPSQDRGTLSFMSFPDGVERSPSSKAMWKMEIKKSSYTAENTLDLVFTPPADAPIGEYIICAKYKEEETVLAMLSVLFNPWCKDDSVYMPEEVERQEYVMNEQGIIYKGSGNYISPMKWDFGQFEESMVNICMRMLDLSHKHTEDPVGDVAARYDPIYVSRVVSAMINSKDDHGVLEGNWSGRYVGGVSPSHWIGSHAILNKWLKYNYSPVKYGQCWVFAAVMCSVMRLLGIPCRVVTNFESAHDTNGNLTIDVYHADYGVREKESPDSVWNFHVWVEGWMKRPDLSNDGKYDGWQAVDPTPQELSGGVYCCGPASVKAILNGDIDLQYDVPFVFAEVNADCVDWLIKADGSQVKIWSDTKRVGQNISTKSVGSNKRLNITNNYKHTEGSDKERAVFKYACSIDYSSDYEYDETEEEVNNEDIEEENEDAGSERNDATNETTESTNEETPNETTERRNEETPNETTERRNEETPNETTERTNEETPNEITESTNEETPNEITERTNEETPNETTESTNEETPDREPAIPPLSMRFTEETKPMNGKDVSLNLVLQSKTSVARQLSINISVQAMMYNCKPAENILTEKREETLHPWNDLLIPIKVPFSVYKNPMLGCDSMKISALVTDKDNTENTIVAEHDVVLRDPPISVTVSGEIRVNHQVSGEVIFNNPIDEMLTNCTLTFAGSGLLRDEHEIKIPDLNPNTQLVVRLQFTPHKTGAKTLMIDFDCSSFRDIQASCAVNVAA